MPKGEARAIKGKTKGYPNTERKFRQIRGGDNKFSPGLEVMDIMGRGGTDKTKNRYGKPTKTTTAKPAAKAESRRRPGGSSAKTSSTSTGRRRPGK